MEAFTTYCEKMSDYPYATRKKYAESASRFLDYLFEAGVFGSNGASAKQINDAIDAYPLLLRDGSDGTVQRIRARGSPPADEWLVQVAQRLAWTRLQHASFPNTIAAINRFLNHSETLAREESERAQILGLPHSTPMRLFKALEGTVLVSSREIARMRQNSMLGAVAKFSPKGIKRPRQLPLPGERQRTERKDKDFPLAHLHEVVNAGGHWRDRALWYLLAASGIRTSEARNLLLQDIDFDEQRVYVNDPKKRRFEVPANVQNELRFKGRTVAQTYLFPPLRQFFFRALKEYLKHEYVAASLPGEQQFLFQYVEPIRRGQPLVNASDNAMGTPFKKAVAAASVPLPADGRNWTLHSLRHAYGVYMLNDYPIAPQSGQFGLSITDVQMLMGHASIRNTEKYARPKISRVIAKLQASDEQMLGLSMEERMLLPSGVLEALGAR